MLLATHLSASSTAVTAKAVAAAAAQPLALAPAYSLLKAKSTTLALAVVGTRTVLRHASSRALALTFSQLRILVLLAS